jgi:hypothetical protein
LFDGHPQCHVHPHELRIGNQRAHTWPRLKPNETPERWFDKLSEEYLATLFVKGRRRIPLKAPGERGRDRNSYPFLLPPAFQRQLFLQEVRRRKPETEREILDCYMTSLFNAWLDNQNLYALNKRWTVAFSPRRAWGDGLETFFELYPDGRLISILRDPLSWYTSAQGRDPNADMDVLLDAWKRSAGEMLRAHAEYGDQTCIVRFDALVLETEKTMGQLAEFLEIEYVPIMALPTFNGRPVGANSSFETRETGVVKDPVDRYTEILSDEQQERIHAECDDLHEQALALAQQSS